MGIIWKSAMPLLSTLAALVIIVHSAEEDRESEYRRDLRPRPIDFGDTHSNEQPWRVVDSAMKHSTTTNPLNNNSQEEPVKYRRGGRKRKRRPQTFLIDDPVSQETNNHPEEPLRPYFEVDLSNTEQSAEIPKRRRKKLESKPTPWNDTPLQRPFRRRGQRKKRPSLKTWPQLSEFNDYHSEESTPTTTVSNEKDDTQFPELLSNKKNDFTHIIKKENDGESFLSEEFLTKVTENRGKEVTTDSFSLVIKNEDRHKMQHRGPYLQEDKSLSEFSFEVAQNANGARKIIKPVTYSPAQNNDPVDPITLKDILKRSNGTSLSEILQLHNLTLADLLNGKENAISILKSEGSYENKQRVPNNAIDNKPTTKAVPDTNKDLLDNDGREKLLLPLETKYVKDSVVEFATTTQSTVVTQADDVYKNDDVETTTTMKPQNRTHKILGMKRYPLGARRKLHMRPITNSTQYKSPLSRDLIALNARKYLHHRKNVTKSIESRNVIPSVINISTVDSSKKENIEISTTTTTTTVQVPTQSDTDSQSQNVIINPDNNKQSHIEENFDIFSTTSAKLEKNKEKQLLDAEYPAYISTESSASISPGLRLNALNNRMKKKRLRQKNLTTVTPINEDVKYKLQNRNTPSSTDVMIKTQNPKVKQEGKDFETDLEDFMTTQSIINFETILKLEKLPSRTHKISEKPAKIEIDEIFNDIETSARISKILMERNMTLRELVEQRERGSSHIHLADIFHNASKEPNPPEPFLSKSIVEPISKETYPLRAILEVNAHDSTNKPLINDPSVLEKSYNNIPVVMDFGNNVNENVENMGIMSLFKNFTKSVNVKHNNTLKKDSEEIQHKTNITVNNLTELYKEIPIVRQSRVFTDRNNPDDVVSWNEIFSLMRKNYKSEASDLLESVQNESLISETPIKISTEEIEGSSLITLKDLQNFKNIDSKISLDSNEGLDLNSLRKTEALPGISEKIPSQTKSVTVATASIAGLAMVLFLLAYAVFKWKQQKVVPDKEHSFCKETIPSPVFENRKAHKNKGSTRSISPMLSTSNIYTLNTLDSRNGKDSPEYMWDTLRKPFQ